MTKICIFSELINMLPFIWCWFWLIGSWECLDRIKIGTCFDLDADMDIWSYFTSRSNIGWNK